MVRRTKEESENTREEILNAATFVFSEKGVATTTLEDIAQAAHVTRGAIYWHFKNKVEIFDALHERCYRPLAEMIVADMQKDHPAPLKQLQGLCTQLLLDVDTDIQKQQTLALFLLKCDYTGELEAYKESHCQRKAESMKLFCGYFERAKNEGQLPAHAEPELMALSVCCYMKGILFEYLQNPQGFDMPRKAPAMMDLFFNTMGR